MVKVDGVPSPFPFGTAYVTYSPSAPHWVRRPPSQRAVFGAHVNRTKVAVTARGPDKLESVHGLVMQSPPNAPRPSSSVAPVAVTVRSLPASNARVHVPAEHTKSP